MRGVVLGVVGVLLGGAYVLAAGAISFQILVADTGAIADLRLAIDGLISPQVPVGLMLVLALVSGSVLGALVLGATVLSRTSRTALVGGFVASIVWMIFWSTQISSARAADSEARPGIHDDLFGWIELGGSNHAVFVVAVLAVGTLWVRFDGVRYAARTST